MSEAEQRPVLTASIRWYALCCVAVDGAVRIKSSDLSSILHVHAIVLCPIAAIKTILSIDDYFLAALKFIALSI
uniref:Uncharacterized protein n=1 Tax=Onchocerca volvulus TaxID=6282 RepID=A0A8R1Y741_ONCVO